MKYLNLGCGNHYSTEDVWVNVDFVSTNKNVIGHNLLQGIPFANESFDLVYHSHVLEHFSKEDGDKFIAECIRVLKPGGILRIAIPNLETIARNYLRYLDEGLLDSDNELIRANYEWTLIEMYDQTLRNQSGGNMKKYLLKDKINNEEFMMSRIGGEAIEIRNNYLTNTNAQKAKKGIKSRFKRLVKNALNGLLKKHYTFYNIGAFRLGGEIHQWMYDRYSLANLLKNNGGKNTEIRDAFSSYISNWSTFELDGKNGVARKPDSLFIETVK